MLSQISKWSLLATLLGIELISSYFALFADDSTPTPPKVAEIQGYPFRVDQALDELDCITTSDRSGPQGSNEPALYDVCISNHFDSQQKSLIRQSFERFLDRAFSRKVLDCALQNEATISLKPEAYIREKIFEPVRARVVRPGAFYVSRVFIFPILDKNLKQFSYGYPYLYLNPMADPGPDRVKNYISIALKPDFVGRMDFAFGNSLDFWAAMISSAYLSNVGEVSGPTASAQAFPYKLLRCIYWNGIIPPAQEATHSQIELESNQ